MRTGLSRSSFVRCRPAPMFWISLSRGKKPAVPLRRARELAGRRFPALRRVQDSTVGGPIFSYFRCQGAEFWCKAR
jgi:hypothetical protein